MGVTKSKTDAVLQDLINVLKAPLRIFQVSILTFFLNQWL